MIRIARCCNPVPGDDIVGFITKGRGISVHRKDCDNLKSLSPEDKARFIDVRWAKQLEDKSFDAEISITAKDQKSMLSSISKICEDMDVRISGLNARADKDETVKINLTLSIKNKEQMEKICRSLKGIPGILEAYMQPAHESSSTESERESRDGRRESHGRDRKRTDGCLIGVEEGDGEQDASYIADKVAGLRIFEDEKGKLNLSVKDVGGSVLAVSQFTLLGDARKGRRPGFSRAAAPEEADALYRTVIEKLRAQDIHVEEGVFRAEMLVEIYNDGPVTILLDSRRNF